jgi:ferrous iron transport protein B
MGSVGLSGRSFIPLLSSFACAIPGIMAARTIANPRDRLVTIMIAPLMTCSARLPVYALLIGAFVPQREVWGGSNCRGWCCSGCTWPASSVPWRWPGCSSADGRAPGAHPDDGAADLPLAQAAQHRHRAVAAGGDLPAPGRRHHPGADRGAVGLASFPAPPEGATGPAIEYSLAGTLGHALALVFEPIGFNWQISIALVPGLAAREVAVSALATVYALSATGDDAAQACWRR